MSNKKKSVLLLGANGMLGKAVSRYAANQDEWEIVTVARSNADICMDLTDDDALVRCFKQVRPHVVINTAAVVNINLCEGNIENAYRVNARLCSFIANLCDIYGGYFVQISTDHYYCGDGRKKHSETDPISLCNEYARTKYIGECLSQLYRDSVILRTNIVGYRCVTYRPTFLEWIDNSIKTGDTITLYDDYYTSSMHTKQLAEIIFKIMDIRPNGIYNVASSQVSSKKEFILDFTDKVYGKMPNYVVGSVELQTDAGRGNSLGLDTRKIEDLIGNTMPDREEVIRSIISERQILGLQ